MSELRRAIAVATFSLPPRNVPDMYCLNRPLLISFSDLANISSKVVRMSTNFLLSFVSTVALVYSCKRPVKSSSFERRVVILLYTSLTPFAELTRNKTAPRTGEAMENGVSVKAFCVRPPRTSTPLIVRRRTAHSFALFSRKAWNFCSRFSICCSRSSVVRSSESTGSPLRSLQSSVKSAKPRGSNEQFFCQHNVMLGTLILLF